MPKAKGKSKRNETSSENGVSAKKIKLESESSSVSESKGQIGGRTVRWEWEGDKHVWCNYGNMNKDICQAYERGESEVDFTAGKAALNIKFETMVQKNKHTGWERRLRCCVFDPTDQEYYVWQWLDEKNRENPYSVPVTLDLEEAYQGDQKEVNFVACHRSYKVNIGAMTQKNTVTDVTRAVSRTKAESEDPTSDPVIVTGSGPSGDAPTSKSRGKGKVKVEKDAAADDEPSTASGRGKSGRGKSGRSGKREEDDGPKVKTMVLKGKAPVDPECTQLVDKAHVYCEGKDIWDTMLNQTNTANNNNKYYLIQLLKEDSKTSFYVWQRWGRVGYKGQNTLITCGGDLDKAKHVFCKKFSDKTKNDWNERDHFEKWPGKYDMLAMDYSAKDSVEDEVDASTPGGSLSQKDIPESKLDARLQNLINLICDVKQMEDAVVEMKYDAKKAPLGKLTKEQITAGYSALKKIDQCLTSGDLGSNLVRACDEFYTRIPHDFGMKQPPVIRDKVTLKSKMQLLEALEDIEIAIKTLKQGSSDDNPIDRHYHAIGCNMTTLDHGSPEFKLIDQYLQNTHAATHNQYKMQLLDVFEMEKPGESGKFMDYGNRMLLWHGSRLTNWVGILSNGLRIAPPEAPVTGYMFGKGVYFADMSSKSANYCFATKTKNEGLLLLCEVSLGNTNDLLSACYTADKLPKGKHSVKGLGKMGPDPGKDTKLSDGTVVPLGKSKDTGVKNPSLIYNEYIVYDTAQIRMRYLVRVKFLFK